MLLEEVGCELEQSDFRRSGGKVATSVLYLCC